MERIALAFLSPLEVIALVPFAQVLVGEFRRGRLNGAVIYGTLFIGTLLLLTKLPALVLLRAALATPVLVFGWVLVGRWRFHRENGPSRTE